MDKDCVVCDQKPVWAWTDTHGVAQCVHCGTPYRLYHYEGDKRVEKPAECQAAPSWIPLLRRYRAETGHMIPGGFSFDPHYEVAQPDDFEAFNGWCDQNRSDVEAAKQSTDR